MKSARLSLSVVLTRRRAAGSRSRCRRRGRQPLPVASFETISELRTVEHALAPDPTALRPQVAGDLAVRELELAAAVDEDVAAAVGRGLAGRDAQARDRDNAAGGDPETRLGIASGRIVARPAPVPRMVTSRLIRIWPQSGRPSRPEPGLPASASRGPHAECIAGASRCSRRARSSRVVSMPGRPPPPVMRTRSATAAATPRIPTRTPFQRRRLPIVASV